MKVSVPETDNSPKKNNNLAELLNDHSIDSIIAFDTQYKIVAWNAMAEMLHGQPKDKAIGMSLFEVIPSLQHDEDTTRAISQAFQGIKSRVPNSEKFAHRLHVENHFIPLKDGDTVVGVMNIGHDVAHRIKAEQQLHRLNEELQRRFRQLQITSDEMASFTYITSNKIKEPIRHIYTGVEYLIKSEAARLTDSGKASFRRMQSSLNRMDLLLDDILKLSQISILQKAEITVDLNDLIKEVADKIQQKTEKQVRIGIGELCCIPGHREYLHLLFYHLLDNAIKFNHREAPEIKISCEKVVMNEANDDFLPLNEFYKLTIADDGIGFNEEDGKRIFTMFEKLHDKQYKGSGMGLAIVQKIMNAHDGFITAESNGHGASFHCFFPALEG